MLGKAVAKYRTRDLWRGAGRSHAILIPGRENNVRWWVRYAVGWAQNGDWLEVCKRAGLVGIEWPAWAEERREVVGR